MDVESKDIEALMNNLDVIDRELIGLLIKRIEVLRNIMNIVGSSDLLRY